MIEWKENESRKDYLFRVALAYVKHYPYLTIEYDETTCDGECLVEDMEAELP